MHFNKEIAGKALTAKRQYQQLDKAHEIPRAPSCIPLTGKAFMAVISTLAHYHAISTLCNSPRGDKARLGGTWPTSAWDSAKN